MLVPKNQHKPSSLPAQKINPKNQNTAVARVNPAKNAKIATVAGVIVNIALAGALPQQLL
ncbi:hypothetical protein [Pelobium manganitolerans]|uniref:hypothetical protein n=1 Tax=Pelobium manganitolerans TaxID=1842495 RepID=UPI000E7314DA|nr:hypothetical protein [Pelobium manganitolerans]